MLNRETSAFSKKISAVMAGLPCDTKHYWKNSSIHGFRSYFSVEFFFFFLVFFGVLENFFGLLPHLAFPGWQFCYIFKVLHLEAGNTWAYRLSHAAFSTGTSSKWQESPLQTLDKTEMPKWSRCLAHSSPAVPLNTWLLNPILRWKKEMKT